MSSKLHPQTQSARWHWAAQLHRRAGWFLLIFAIQTAVSAAPLITTNAVWKFKKGRADLAPSGTGWRKLSFDDRKWKSFPAPFFYGEEAEGTEVDEMYGLYPTIYLRKKFDIADASQVKALILNARCDDGLIAWINGVEVWRFNVADGSVSSTTTALGPVPEPSRFIEHALLQPSAYLVNGRNVLAVQVFNASLKSGDLFFDLEMYKPPAEGRPPLIAAVEPPPGVVPSLAQITVTFNELVTGVKASDLIVNHQAAARVLGADRVYTFQFAAPAGGSLVDVNWDPNNRITDLSPSPNRFQAVGPGANWRYEIGNPDSLRVSELHPPKDATVAQIAQVEVTFSDKVTGVAADSLLLNGQPALKATGHGAGPYLFEYPPAAAGLVQMTWKADPGIRRATTGEPLSNLGGWFYSVDPALAGPAVRINEIMAGYQAGFLDEDGESSGWIELYNSGSTPINLEGWSLSNDPKEPDEWIFPALVLPPHGYQVIFASTKDRRSRFPGSELHTNFRLGPGGEYLGLYDASAPRELVDQFAPEYPEQQNNYSYGWDSSGQLKYFNAPTPGGPNGSSALVGMAAAVHFSVDHGFSPGPFQLELSSATPGAEIRYTFDGSLPNSSSGNIYTGPITIGETKAIRAAAFHPNYVRSSIQTRTYIVKPSAAIQSLPVMSLVSAPDNLYGSDGILAIKGGKYVPVGNPKDGVTHWQAVNSSDYNNPTQMGAAWERPVSIELLPTNGTKGFKVDAGIRVAGSDTSRLEYRANSKFSFRAYFRGRYGARNLEYPLFGDLPVREFDRLDIRAGHNDPVNPFITDELMRRLFGDTGQLTVHGTLVNVFLNGRYQGYYNPIERITASFLHDWLGGTNDWDIISPASHLRNGDLDAWLSLTNYISSHDLTVALNYLEVARRLDLTNFVDYLLVNIYGDTHDWTLTNWNAAREQTPDGRFRFFVIDAEFALGIYDDPPSNNALEDPHDLGNGWEISSFFKALRRSPEFRLLFADRIQKHFFNNGALTDANILRRFQELRTEMLGVLPKMSNQIATIWVPKRRGFVMNHFAAAGFLASDTAPAFSQPGGPTAPGTSLTMQATKGRIYYTTDGSDPRVMFSGAVAPTAQAYSNIPLTLSQSVVVKARTLSSGNWSALTEAGFLVLAPPSAVRITEIMYHPADGDAYEFLELFNNSAQPVDLSGYSFHGLTFTFPPNSILPPHTTAVLAGSEDPAAFRARYPGLAVAGFFEGNLSNGGEKIALLDPQGNAVFSVDYSDKNGWPPEADGAGPSLELISLDGDPNDPANWRASLAAGGTPGQVPGITVSSSLGNPSAGDPGVFRLQLEHDGGRVILQFQAASGMTYSLQRFPLGSGGPWIGVSDFGPFSGAQTVTVPHTISPEAGGEFFRLVSPAAR